MRAHSLNVPVNPSTPLRAVNDWPASAQSRPGSSGRATSFEDCLRVCGAYLGQGQGGAGSRTERVAHFLAVVAWSDHAVGQNDATTIAAVTHAASVDFANAVSDDARWQDMTSELVETITRYFVQEHQRGADASMAVSFVGSMLDPADATTCDAALLLQNIADHLQTMADAKDMTPAKAILSCAVYAMAELAASNLMASSVSPNQDACRNIEFPVWRFKDGSRRPDRLVAPALPHAGITLESGRLVKGNHFGLPQFIMTNSMANEAHTDSHMHLSNYVQQGLTLERLLDMMDEIGIRSSTLMPIPTSLQVIKRDGDALDLPAPAEEAAVHMSVSRAHESVQGCGLEAYYLPQDIQQREMKLNGGKPLSIEDFRRAPSLLEEIVQRGELYLDTSVNSHLASHIRRADLTAAQRSRLDPMLTGINLGDERAATRLLTELYHNRGVFTGIGEITVHKEIVELMYAGQRGQANLISRSNGLLSLFEMAGVVGMPVVLHCDIDSLHRQMGDPQPSPEQQGIPAHFEVLRRLFTHPRAKDTVIIWAHAGGLGRFIQQGPQHLQLISTLLRQCPNLNLDISWSEVARQICRQEVKTAWTHFFETNSARICFGSDTLAPHTAGKWGETKRIYADILSRLSPASRGNILNHTYERLIAGARDRVRHFERKVLTSEFYETYLINPLAEQPLSASTVRAFYSQ